MFLPPGHFSRPTALMGSAFPGLENVLLFPDFMATAGCALVALVMLVCIIRWIMRGSTLRRAAAADAIFTEAFRHSAHALALFERGVAAPGSPRGALYTNACRDLAFHLVGSDTVDRNFSLRLRAAGRITTTQWEATERAARRSLDESARWLRSGLSAWGVKALLPLGMLGSLLAVMEHAGANTFDFLRFASSMRPLALALLCHVIGMAWNRRMARLADDAVAELEDFSTEFGILVERSFVDHRYPIETLPSLEGMGLTDGPSLALPPAETARNTGR
jgi:hypothetical protein